MDQAEKNEWARGCHLIRGEGYTGYMCTHVGVSRVTDVVVKQHASKDFEARVGVALLGGVQSEEHLEKHPNPFDPEFMENYCEGHGDTEEKALEAMAKDMREMADSLFA